MKRKMQWQRALALAVCLILMLSTMLTAGIQSVGADIPQWQPNVEYQKDALVSYNGKIYQCIYAHKSLDGWQPSNVPALWKVVEGTLPPTSTPIPTNTPTPTTTAETGFKISGYVKPNFSYSNPAVNSGFKVELAGKSLYGTTDNNGYFEIKNVSKDTSGTTVLKITKNGYLRREIKNVTINGNIAVGSISKPVGIWAGDINQDGAINMADISQELLPYFNTSSIDPNYNPDLDFNKDGAINMEDILILIINFNKSVADYPNDVEIVTSVPTPSPTTVPTSPPPTTPVNTSLPKRIMVGYWHTWGGNNPFIKLRDVDPNWDVINIAFTEPVSPGSGDGRMKFVISGLSTVSGYTINDFKADVKMLQSKGKKIVLSIGGYEGWFYLGSSAAISQFVKDIKSFVDEYGFDGIDIDLEQDSIMFDQGKDPLFKKPTSPRIVNMISAIRQICDSYGPNFMLTWAPETFYLQNGIQYYAGIHQYCLAKAGCYIPLIHALRDKTTFVHAQLYNSTPMMGNDGKLYNMGTVEGIVAMCDMVLQGFKIMGKDGDDYFFPPLRPDQVVIGVPASASAANSGQLPNASLQQAFRTLVSKYPDLRGIMTWSINWDSFQNGNSFVRENKAFLNTLK
ncbi:MAG: glycosyl hydrolase family 18 protein [Clostridia bacterium]|nr:glycosyl hydrolase family 18 protein [Clostridia bacterium]